jgi:GxxExxY protein
MVNVEFLKNDSYDVIGAIHEVHKTLGPGLNEYVYQEALELELNERDIPYQREVTFHPTYKGTTMQAGYRVDFLCKRNIIIELKAVETLNQEHKAQLFNYMRLLEKSIGIIVNFSPKFAQIERYFYDIEKREILTVYGNPLVK